MERRKGHVRRAAEADPEAFEQWLIARDKIIAAEGAARRRTVQRLLRRPYETEP